MYPVLENKKFDSKEMNEHDYLLRINFIHCNYLCLHR